MPTVSIDGTEHEIDLDAIRLDEGQRIVTDEDLARDYISREKTQGDDAEYMLTASVRQRYKNYVHRQKAADDDKIVATVLEKHALDNPEVVQRVLDTHGEALKNGTLEDAKKQWDASIADPLRAERDAAAQKLGTFTSMLVREAVQANAVGVWDDKFTSAPPGRQSYIVSQLEGDHAWCEEHGYVAARRRGSNGEYEFIPSDNPTRDRPFMDSAEYQRKLAATPEWKPLVRPGERITTEKGAAPTGQKPGTSPQRRGNMTQAQKAAYVTEHGKDAYLALPL